MSYVLVTQLGAPFIIDTVLYDAILSAVLLGVILLFGYGVLKLVKRYES